MNPRYPHRFISILPAYTNCTDCGANVHSCSEKEECHVRLRTALDDALRISLVFGGENLQLRQANEALRVENERVSGTRANIVAWMRRTLAEYRAQSEWVGFGLAMVWQIIADLIEREADRVEIQRVVPPNQALSNDTSPDTQAP